MTILGQDRAIAAFRAAMDSGHLHHAWLLAGPRGVGKGSFARAAARRVLADAAGPRSDLPGLEVAPGHRIAHLVDAGSHPDFRLLERQEWDKGSKKGELRRNVTIDQVREMGELFALAPSFSDWRVCIIDAMDDLERNAANALLKLLEEPPGKSLFLLVSHSPGRLLPTIRSRCRRLDFTALDDASMDRVLAEQQPKLSAADRARLLPLAAGSAARAIEFAELDLAPLAEEALAILRHGDPDNSRRARLATSLALKAAAPRYAAFLELVPPLVAAEARRAEGERRSRAAAAYAQLRETATFAPRHSLDPASTILTLGTIMAGVSG
ncbi:DNA polymerase III subunit delta' [Sphingomonas sp. LHG3406-1]|uniref:DNA polymerase III subunit delta' n=1 Tax=Sphingomonas sp. LHG3406-1 TaxID=2804617 RepID=UPI002625E8FC|nr:DNA polymerase III subunit delta' [Sphingomonas sp. LHG3406-1]